MSLEDLSPEELKKLRAIIGAADSPAPDAPLAEEKEKQETRAPRKSLWKNKVFLMLVSGVAMIGLAVGYVTVVEPWLTLQSAKSELTQEVKRSPVIASNDKIVSYEPESEEDRLPGANPKQLALSSDGKVAEAPYFEFKSENAHANSHEVDLYLDFYSQRGRDFISLNRDIIKNQISSGKIVLRVYPVVQTNGFSIFAPEALAEVVGTHPEQAWDFFTSLMKNSGEILSPVSTEATQPSSKQLVDFIAEVSKDSGVPTGSPSGVDADSIKYLSFFSWLRSGGDDERLQVGYYPPILYIDGTEVDQEKYSLGDPDKVLELFTSLK